MTPFQFVSPGKNSTEFKMSAINMLGSFALLGYMLYQGSFEQYQALVSVLIANITVAGLGYGYNRTQLKRTELIAQAEMMKKEDQAEVQG
jgi:hypothetical protein